MGYQSASDLVITPSTVVTRRPDQVSAPIEDQTALMSLNGGVYFLIDAIGTEIWSQIGKPTRVEDLCANLVRSYEVEPENCERDVIGFLSDLLARELVDVVEQGKSSDV